MNRCAVLVGLALPLSMAGFFVAHAQQPAARRLDPTVFGDWRSDAPGVRRKITASDIPPLSEEHNSVNPPHEVSQPHEGGLKAPAGFSVQPFATGLKSPRVIRIAPNGDVFVAETEAGRVRVLRADPSTATAKESRVFVSGLDGPYGIAFYPSGPNPSYVYIATTTTVRRYPYHSGDLTASGPPEILLSLPAGGHTTRDIVFSPDQKTLYVSVGSSSNYGEDLPKLSDDQLRAFIAGHALGAAWGPQLDRADVLAFNPNGGDKRVVATGLRNCAGLTIQPATGALWCAVNERDLIGDDVPPDFATSVKQNAFYGWPWYYIGDHPDPRLAGARPDLAKKVDLPDVLFQAHSAPLGITFYEANQFPAEYKGDAFVTMHGSYNRAKRTGYKIVRLLFKNGRPTGEYEDFLTGFVVDDANVWGKPVDSAVAPDGSLLFTDNVGGKVWRVSFGEG